jgi:O-antigen/teichoic acid export membrane protein
VNQLRVGAVLAYANLLANNLLALAVTPLMLRSLGQSEFGLYSLMGAFVAHIAVLDLGLGNAIVRYAAKFRAEGNAAAVAGLLSLCLRLYCAVALLALAVGTLVYLNLPALFSATLSDADLSKARRLFALMVVNLALSFPLGAYAGIVNAHERFVFVRFMNLVRAFVRTGVVVGLLLLGFKAFAIVALDTALNVAVGLLNVYYARARLGVRSRRYAFDPDFPRGLAVYSGFVFLGVIVDQLYWKIGHIVVGAVEGTTAVAVFAIAVQIATYYMAFPMAVGGVFLPRVTAMVVGGAGSGDLLALFVRTARIQLLVLTYVLGGFLLVGQEFITLWAGAEYRDAWQIALVMMVPLTVPLSQTIGLHILQARNLHRFRSLSYLCVAVLNVAASIGLVRWWGAIGAAVATASSLVAGNIVAMNLYYHFRIGLDMRRFARMATRGIVPAAVAAVAIGGAGLMVPGCSWTGLVARGTLYTAAYAASAWRFGMNQEERELVRTALSSLGFRRFAAGPGYVQRRP